MDAWMEENEGGVSDKCQAMERKGVIILINIE